jgi:hypothetical protein
VKRISIAGVATLLTVASVTVMAATSSAVTSSGGVCPGNVMVSYDTGEGAHPYLQVVAINYSCAKAKAFVKASFARPEKGVKAMGTATVPGPAGFWCVITTDLKNHPYRGSCVKGPKGAMMSSNSVVFNWPYGG